MEVLKDRYTITELSERLSITDHALRYYEKEFGLNVPKDERGRRYYTPEIANIMFQIKTMRDDGLEIKAIRKILQSDNVINEPPPVVDEATTTLVAVNNVDTTKEIMVFFDEFKQQLTISVSAEVSAAKEQLSKELFKTKLELGACFEDGVRKLESKMDRHFQEVDKCLSDWRQRNNRNIFKRLADRVFK